MSSSSLPPNARPIWTPDDTAALRAAADQFPTEIGQSPMLRLICEREGVAL